MVARRYPLTAVMTWAAILALVTVLQGGQGTLSAALGNALVLVLVLASGVHLHFRAFDGLFRTRRYLSYLAVVSALVTGCAALLTAGLPGPASGLGQNLVNVFSVLVVSLGLRYARDGVVGQYRLQEVRAAQLEAELRLLKQQVNPHFLLNTLNNLYALALERSERTPEAIMQLAELMRELLASSREPTTRLSTEWRVIESYVALERLRLGDGARLTLTWAAPREDVALAPLLLIPLVENAFTHGCPGSRAQVGITLHSAQGQVRLQVENARCPVDPPPGSGTGLANLRHRLALVYPGRHRLEVEATAGHHVASLEVRP